MLRPLKRFGAFISLLTAAVLIVFGLQPAYAASGNTFKADRIIDDAIFFNTAQLSVTDIQNFLNSKVPTCDTNHTGSGSNQPPFTCLKDYSQTISDRAADQYCTGAVSAGTKSSAQIIKDVANACGINAAVLIVLLQKEQSLITDTWPWASQYEKATGYYCPDDPSRPGWCDPEYAGFFNQVWYAARQFQRYVKQPGSFNFAVGRASSVLFQANRPSCGGTTLTMQTRATAALYNYTPYQPSQAALDYLYGVAPGDPNTPGTPAYCAAYGNRNFWRLFNDWFGPTTSDNNTDVISFVRLNHASGNVEVVGYTSISEYSYPARHNFSSYPSVPADGNVIPLFWPNGDLVFVRLNHASGNVEVVSYSANSGYKQLVNIAITGYPSVPGDGNVIPMFKPNGDLSFIRLNHSSGNVEVVSYGPGSNYRSLTRIQNSSYPSVPADGNVIPLFWPNGDLVFVRLNHASGNVEVVSYSANSGYKQLVNIAITGYPSVPGDGNVIPMFKPNGDLSFIRLNHSSGNVEVATYSASSNYKQLIDLRLTGYPNVANDGAVIPLFTR